MCLRKYVWCKCVGLYVYPGCMCMCVYNNRIGALQEVSRPANGNSSICDDVQQYSGYYKLTTGGVFTKNYFYWFFESRGSPATDPVVLWMTGGPGCSSEVALFGENGPCSVNAGGNDTITNPYSWNTNANIL